MIGGNLDYCFVMGRGGTGTWSVNGSDDMTACKEIANDLGGRLYDSHGDGDSAAGGGASSATSATPSPAPAPIAAPTVFQGSGDSVVSITKPGGDTGTVIATITGNRADRFFAVKALDGDQDLLANTTDPYSGSTLLDAGGGNTTQLQVQAVGPWSITLSDIRSAPLLNAGANSGTGDSVLLYRGSSGTATITGNQGARFFAVEQYTGTGRNVLVNTTDPYQGSVPLAGGPALVTVQAVGSWTITTK